MRKLWPLVLCALAACGPRKPEVRLYTWDNYDDPEIFAEFERRHGVRVVSDHFASNEELLAKLMGGVKGYDVIVPSDYMVAVMARQGLLAELDRRKLPNLRHLDERFLDAYFDPGNRHSVPYLWGLTGIGYDAERVNPPPRSWADLWDPKHQGRVSLLNDQREVFALALQSLGLPVNTRDPAHLRRAQEFLKSRKDKVRTFNSENNETLLLTGEVLLAHIWSTDLYQALEERPSLRFVMPKEGGTVWQDNLCIPRSSENQEAAHKLIDFLMDPDNAARLVRRTFQGTPNKSARERLPEDLARLQAESEKALKNASWIHDAGDAAPLYDRLWTELKAG